MVAAVAIRLRLGEIVEEGAEAYRQRGIRVRSGLDDREDVLVERPVLPGAGLLVAEGGLEFGQDLGEHACVAGEPQRPEGVRAQQELRQLAHAVRSQSAADPLGRDIADLRCPVVHLAQRVLVRLEAEL